MTTKKKKVRGFRRLLHLEGDPAYVAKGFALGSFIGMMPVPGFQMLISLAIASIIKVHKTAAIIGVFNTNVGTGLFVFAFNYWLGKTLLGLSPSFHFPETVNIHFFSTILSAGSEVFFSMLVGGIITGIVSWLFSYHLILFLLNKKKYHE